MNKGFVEINDELVAVTDENGNLDLKANSKNIKDILSLENQISEAQEAKEKSILEYNKLKSDKLSSVTVVIINLYGMILGIGFGAPILFLKLGNSILDSVLCTALVVGGSFAAGIAAANILITLPMTIHKKKKNKKLMLSYEETIKKYSKDIETKAKKLTSLKEEVSYKEIIEDKKEIYEYSYTSSILNEGNERTYENVNIKGFTKKKQKNI